VALVFGSAVCFGGAVWWFRTAVAGVTIVLVGTTLTRQLLQGRVFFLKSPLSLLGLLALALGLLQLVPLPPALARRLSPNAHQIYSSGTVPALAQTDLPSVRFDELATVRSPATLDRAATLRWLVGALACLGIFWAVTHFADRLGRLYLIWGCVVAAFVLNAALALVQIMGQAEGMYGFLQPGKGPIWAPSHADLFEAPSTAVLRRLGPPSARADGAAPFERFALVPDKSFLFGTMMGGTGAFLALASLALPLALAIVLHVISPRGSRESLANRLKHTGQGGLTVLLLVMLVVSTLLVGMMAGPWLCLPFALGMAAVGLPRAAGPRWLSIGLLSLLFVSLGLGATLAVVWPKVIGGEAPFEPMSGGFARLVWTESLPLVRDFPLVGTGLGSFATIYPYVKTHDTSLTTAMSSLLQCAVESGAVGLAILAMAAVWCLFRLPGCLKRVSSADRTLAYGLIGAALGFSLWSIVHWTVELPAVAISASALGGTWNRWLAGGTDLFVERG
jgi:O-Antigen ligase